MENQSHLSETFDTLWAKIAPDASMTIGLNVIALIIAGVVGIKYWIEWKRSKGNTKEFAIGLSLAALVALPGVVLPILLSILDVIINIIIAIASFFG